MEELKKGEDLMVFNTGAALLDAIVLLSLIHILPKEKVLFVGDQIFTDILGARRAGIYSILVQPIHPKEEIQIVLKRKLEKIVLSFYKKKRAKEKNS